jgi:hypothetical protein
MRTMENDAPIQFLTPPGAEQAEPNMLAAALVLAAICAFLVYVAIRGWARSRSGNVSTVATSGPQGARTISGKPIKPVSKVGRRKPAKAPKLTGGLLSSASARRSGGCRWRMDKRRDGVISTRWTCTTCGVEAYTQGDRPPKECKRALRPASI